MKRRISAAEAKAHFSELIAKVAYGGEKFVIERRGKPMAALVSVEDAEHLLQRSSGPTAAEPRGALGLVGAWSGISDEDIDAMIDDIYKSRKSDTGRSVELPS